MSVRPLVGSLVVLLTLGCAEVVTDVLEYGSIEVSASRRSGEPVEGAQLILYIGAQTRGVGRTDPDGRHRFSRVPPNLYGVYAEPPAGYVRPEVLLGGPTTAFVDGISLAEGEERTVGFTFLKEGPGRIVATVRTPGGDPVPGTVVSLFSPQGTLEEVTVGGSEVVTFDPVPFGNWGVRVAPPELYLAMGESVFEEDGILIEEGGEETVAFLLEPCQGTLTARVRTEEGEPVPSFPVRLYGAGGTAEEGLTGTEGERTFGPLLCREFGLALLPAPGWEFEEGPGKSVVDGLIVSRGSSRTVPFTVQACFGSVEARVRNDQGTPVAGALLTLYAPDGSTREGSTGPDGTFLFSRVLCGQEYGVQITPPPGYSVPEGRGSSFFDGLRPRGPQPVVLEFTLQRTP